VGLVRTGHGGDKSGSIGQTAGQNLLALGSAFRPLRQARARSMTTRWATTRRGWRCCRRGMRRSTHGSFDPEGLGTRDWGLGTRVEKRDTSDE
jgi:hypothetical protein